MYTTKSCGDVAAARASNLSRCTVLAIPRLLSRKIKSHPTNFNKCTSSALARCRTCFSDIFKVSLVRQGPCHKSLARQHQVKSNLLLWLHALPCQFCLLVFVILWKRERRKRNTAPSPIDQLPIGHCQHLPKLPKKASKQNQMKISFRGSVLGKIPLALLNWPALFTSIDNCSRKRFTSRAKST